MKRRRWRAVLIAVVGSLLVASTGAFAQAASVYLETPYQGDVTENGYEDQIEVFEFHHLVTGESASTHEPVVFVKKRQDKSTVDLWQAMDQGTQFSATFHWASICSGNPVERSRITFMGARVVAIEPWSRNGADGTDEFERVRLDYQSMDVRYELFDASCLPRGAESHVVSNP